MLICSEIILRFADVTNICYILTEASHFNALALVDKVQEYMSANMETLLESRMLDVLSPFLMKQLSLFVQKRQSARMPVQRTGSIVARAMGQYGGWLAMQDIPQPVLPSTRLRKNSGRVSLQESRTPASPRQSLPGPSPVLHTQATNLASTSDDVFTMDEMDLNSSHVTAAVQPMAWKASSIARYVLHSGLYTFGS